MNNEKTDDPMHCYTYTDDNESTDGKQENIPAMDYTYTQEEEDKEGNFITNLYKGLPDLIPQEANRNPDRVPPPIN